MITDGSVTFAKLADVPRTILKALNLTGSAITINKGTTGVFTLDVDTQPGYTPIGLLAWTISGSNTSYLVVYAAFTNAANEAKLYIRNNNTSNNVTATFSVRVLYIRNEFFVEPEP